MPMLSPGNDVTVTSDCGRSLRSDQSSVYSGGFEKKADSFEGLLTQGWVICLFKYSNTLKVC